MLVDRVAVLASQCSRFVHIRRHACKTENHGDLQNIKMKVSTVRASKYALHDKTNERYLLLDSESPFVFAGMPVRASKAMNRRNLQFAMSI